jgi:hypothetical protein
LLIDLFEIDTMNNAREKGNISHHHWNIPTETFHWNTCLKLTPWTMLGRRGIVFIATRIYQRKHLSQKFDTSFINLQTNIIL